VSFDQLGETGRRCGCYIGAPESLAAPGARRGPAIHFERMSLRIRTSYRFLAPIYDRVVDAPLRQARRESLAALPAGRPQLVLLDGVGTGLDLPHLPAVHRYVGLDLTRAMLDRARARPGRCQVQFVEGDSQALPFADACFDHAVLHLILAVVPDAARCLSECARVLKPGGTALILDKFLRRGERAWLRRALNPLARRIATRTNVIFEDVLAAVPALRPVDDQPAFAGGWFRCIRLVRRRE
jgi:phosphatidylethanolamine/phosphatidyl-N-methylethanolamine N-methyltransferase